MWQISGLYSSTGIVPLVAATFTGLLDSYPGANVAFSLRKLRAAYTGSAVRIRRSSDNAEADIGFDGSGNFDSAAAASHIGGGTGYIATWYDQSGNANNATQATAANQPQYSTAVTAPNGATGAVLFSSASSTVLNTSSVASVATSNFATLCWFHLTSTASHSNFMNNGTSATGYSIWVSNAALFEGLYNNVAVINPAQSVSTGQWYQGELQKGATNTQMYLDATNVLDSNQGTPVTPVTRFTIGDNGGGNMPNGYIDTIVQWDTTFSDADITAIHGILTT